MCNELLPLTSVSPRSLPQSVRNASILGTLLHCGGRHVRGPRPRYKVCIRLDRVAAASASCKAQRRTTVELLLQDG